MPLTLQSRKKKTGTNLCIAFTDHSASLSLLNSPHPSAKLERWAMCIQEFDLVIKHKSGKHNTKFLMLYLESHYWRQLKKAYKLQNASLYS